MLSLYFNQFNYHYFKDIFQQDIRTTLEIIHMRVGPIVIINYESIYENVKSPYTKVNILTLHSLGSFQMGR